MKTSLLYGAPDLMYNSHAGFIFVVPLPQGRLASLVKENEGRLKGWCFTDPHPKVPTVMCGTYKEGEEFILNCTALGLQVALVSNLNVPFTGGVRVGRHDADELGYFPSEYAAVRQDIPSREELMKMLDTKGGV
jgi:hypothetical protein